MSDCSDIKLELDRLDELLDEKIDDIVYLVSVIREIYSIVGEDKQVSKICNAVLESQKFERF